MVTTEPVGNGRDKGFIFGVAIILVAAGVVTLLVSDGWKVGGESPGGWIYEYQSLIAGLLAVAAAVVTIWYLRRQIQAAEEVAERARRVDLASLNRPLITRLDEIVQRTEEAGGLFGDQGFRSLTKIDRALLLVSSALGSELAAVGLLTAVRGTALGALQDLRTKAATYENNRSVENAGILRDSYHNASNALEHQRLVAMFIASRLSFGWSVLELDGLSYDELSALGPP